MSADEHSRSGAHLRCPTSPKRSVMFVNCPAQWASRRDFELQNSEARSHAARVSYCRQRISNRSEKLSVVHRKSSNLNQNASKRLDTHRNPGKIPSSRVKGVFGPVRWIDQGSSSWERIPPLSLVSCIAQYQRDPFQRDPMYNLPTFLHDLMELGKYRVQWDGVSQESRHEILRHSSNS